MLLSDFPQSYIKSVEAGAEFHKTYKIWAGKATMNYKDLLKDLVNKYQIKTLLDFGCGKGLQYTKHKLDKFLNVQATAYDPCLNGLENWPKSQFDMVICLDCLPYIDTGDYAWLYNQLDTLASKLIVLGVQLNNIPKSTNKSSITSNIQKITDLQDITKPIPQQSQSKFVIINNFKLVN